MNRRAVLITFFATLAFAGEDAGTGAVLSVKIAVRSADGAVACSLFTAAEGFPKDQKRAVQQTGCAITGGSALCKFTPIPAGTYAVACFHDENGNQSLDTNFLGIPKEGVCVSNNAKGSMGPPKYEDAKFVFSGAATELSLQARY
jgi:uncharacterized protein (DUF2141 family)